MSKLEALRIFETRLRTLNADYTEATTVGEEDWQKRLYAHQSLMAVIELLESISATRGIDSGFVKLLEALTEIEKGRTVNWLISASGGRPPLPDRVLLLRSRYAGVMEYLMQNDHKREQAARIVARSLSKNTVDTLGARSWRSIAEWRDSLTGHVGPDREGEKHGYEMTLKLLADMTGSPAQRAGSMLQVLARV
ncbi:hypothetical protein [Sinorhizobium meliloti]|uniref:hypothetical protein n=1 Tax=Rhizobium meliloti TaxID=382 RepID=UPI000480A042|nr:hypothetical protein [Sinorhizobium meliloti]MDE4620646.1 hypothetical protein [Sinorhizobium meliloti]